MSISRDHGDCVNFIGHGLFVARSVALFVAFNG